MRRVFDLWISGMGYPILHRIGGGLVLSLWLTVSLHAQFLYVDVDEQLKGGSAVIPFAFYTQSTQYAAGAAWLSRRWPQEQMSLILAGYGSTDGSWGVPFLARGVQLPCGDRLFLDVTSFFAHYGNFDAYRDGNPSFPLERSGSNESSEDNFIRGRGRQYFVDPTLRYVLPVGDGAETTIHTYTIDEGMLVGNPMGGGPWDPLEGGRSYLEVTPFYRAETIANRYLHDTRATNGLKGELIYDNRDFHLNPSRGSRQALAVSRDWGLFDSADSWTSLEVDYSKYIPLPTSAGTRQQVLAFDFWTAYTPTWRQVSTDAAGKPVFQRPPEFKGARLGGYFRMRAFYAHRFSDKAAIYYSGEYRIVPQWNPCDSISWLDWLRVRWIQAVLFAEVGRVAPTWSLDDLHRDMKWDVGVGLRLWGRDTVIRADVAFADEAGAVHLMIGHPF